MGEIQRSGTEALAQLLTEARDRLGLTRRELAEQTGLSYPYVSQLETGYRGPSPGAMQRLTEVLGVPVQDMVAAMAERDGLSGRVASPGPRPVPAKRYKTAPGSSSEWVANPAWTPREHRSPRNLAAPAASLGVTASAVPESAGNPQSVETFARRARLRDDERLVTLAGEVISREDLISSIVGELGALPVQERMAALAEIQNRVVHTVVADSTPPTAER